MKFEELMRAVSKRVTGRRFWSGTVCATLVGSLLALPAGQALAATSATTKPPLSAPLPHYPPAPASFETQMVKTMQDMQLYTNSLPQARQDVLPTLFAKLEHYFSTQSPEQWAIIYHAVSGISNWEAIVSRLQSLNPANHQKSSTGPASYRVSPATAPAYATALYLEPSATTPAYQLVSGAGSLFNPSSAPPDTCFPGVTQYAIKSVAIAANALRVVADFLPDVFVEGAVIAGEGVITTIPDPAQGGLLAAADALDLTQSVLELIQQFHDQCESNAFSSLFNSLYNDLSNSQSLIYSQTVTIINDLNALTTLTDNRTSEILNNIAALSALVRSLTQTTLNNLQAVTNLVDSQDLTLLNAVAHTQSSLDSQLKIQIQTNLLTGAQANVATFELPASAGGYLNSSPIGVQSVVTSAFNKMQSLGIAIPKVADTALSYADTALAKGLYKVSYFYYKAAYQLLVSIPGPPAGPVPYFGSYPGPFPFTGPFPGCKALGFANCN